METLVHDSAASTESSRPPTARAYIGLGSNLGDREGAIRFAAALLDQHPRIRVKAVSRLLNTAPVGSQNQPDFLNAVAELETDLDPFALLDVLLDLERHLGRVRGERWGPRTIDLDLLLYGSRRIDHPRLRVPHPEIMNRWFLRRGLDELGAPPPVLRDG